MRGAKLPETQRRATVRVVDLLDLAAGHVREHYSVVRESAKGKARDRQALDSRCPALAAEFGQLEAATLTPLRIQQGLAKIAGARKWAPATVNRHKAFLSLAYRRGMEEGLVTLNPARLVRQRREDNGRIRYLTNEEEPKLRAVIREDWLEHEPEFDLAINTGMRASEQYGLDWQRNVDLERRQFALYRTKNKRPRYIPINEPAMRALLALRARSGSTGPVIRNVERVEDRQARKARHWFEQAVAKAGIADFAWHCLRHTFSSRLIMAGVDLRTVQELMGHRTIQMTCRYAHLAPQLQLKAVVRLAGPESAATATKTATGGFGPAGAGVARRRQLTANKRVGSTVAR